MIYAWYIAVGVVLSRDLFACSDRSPVSRTNKFNLPQLPHS